MSLCEEQVFDGIFQKVVKNLLNSKTLISLEKIRHEMFEINTVLLRSPNKTYFLSTELHLILNFTQDTPLLLLENLQNGIQLEYTIK